MADYSNQLRGSMPELDRTARPSEFIVPELCNATAISLLVLIGELLVLVLLFAGGPIDWARFALMSLFVQWVALASAGLLCWSRALLARFGLVTGAVLAFLLILLITLVVGVSADRILVGSLDRGIDFSTIVGQLVISGIISALALRYFYVQQQLREQEQSELQSRIQALQSRIRPHFLFNSMNIIASLIATDPDTAETVVEDLSELFRASLNDAGNQVPLKEELDLCERYVRIESLRLGDRLKLTWDVEETSNIVKIPLLTLQPLLENAIYHGIQPLPRGGTISVRLWYENEEVKVEITNPLPPENTRSRSQGNQMALNNIRSRLNALYGARAELTTATRDGLHVTSLTYPFATQVDEVDTP